MVLLESIFLVLLSVILLFLMILAQTIGAVCGKL